MPTDIQHLFDLDFRVLFSSVVIFMAGWIALKSLLTKFSEATGIEMPWMRSERERAEQVEELHRRVNLIDEKVVEIANSVTSMTDTVNTLSNTLNGVEKRLDANEAAKLKDRISESYRYYHERHEWTSMEKEAFHDLIEAYTQYSTNSFVHTICEPESETWNVIEKD